MDELDFGDKTPERSKQWWSKVWPLKVKTCIKWVWPFKTFEINIAWSSQYIIVVSGLSFPRWAVPTRNSAVHIYTLLLPGVPKLSTPTGFVRHQAWNKYFVLYLISRFFSFLCQGRSFSQLEFLLPINIFFRIRFVSLPAGVCVCVLVCVLVPKINQSHTPAVISRLVTNSQSKLPHSMRASFFLL